MKYFYIAKQYILVLRLIRAAKNFRAEGDYYRACVSEYYARIASDQIHLMYFQGAMVKVTAQYAPIDFLEEEAKDSLRFFRKGFSNWIKFKYET